MSRTSLHQFKERLQMGTRKVWPTKDAGSGSGSWVSLVFLVELVSAVISSAIVVIKKALLRLYPPQQKSLQGEIALVTGAGSGIGRHVALHLASEGCVVVCVDQHQTNNELTALEITSRFDSRVRGGQQPAYSFTCDVTNCDEVRNLAVRVLTEVGHVSLLINNAGVVPRGDLQPAQVVDVFKDNIMSHFWTVLAFLPEMKARNHGHIVAISSMANLCGLPHKAPYSSSKFAVTGFMDALQEELRLQPAGIMLTRVHPHFTGTRPGLPEDLHLRIPELTPEFAAKEIVTAIRQNASVLTVPRNLLFWTNVLRALPPDARDIWRDLFHTRAEPTPPANQNTAVKT